MQLYYRLMAESHLRTCKAPIVLLHGLFGMSDNLLGLANALSEHYCVLIPDLINHGRSPHRPDMSYPAMAEDVFLLLDDLGGDQAVVLGHSMGGKVAMQMALLHPQRVQQLLVADISPVDYPDRHSSIIAAMYQVEAAKVRQRRDAESILARFIDEAPLRAFFMKNMQRGDDGIWRWRFGLNEIAEAYPAIAHAPQVTGKYNGPCLFLKGQNSDYILPQHQPVIEALFPEAQLKVVGGAGHWLHAEKPAAFNRLVHNFVAEHYHQA